MTSHHDDPPARAAGDTRGPPDPAEPAHPRAALRRPRLDPLARARLGQSLRLYYASLTEQPLPDRFARLLDDLSATDTTRRDA